MQVNDENEDGSCNRATDGPLFGELEYSQASETGCETTTSGLETPSDSGASSPEPCQRPTDWECVSVTAIAELEMMKEDLEHFLFENLEKFGRLLNLESKHSGRDNASLSRGANKLASLLSTEFEEDEYDDDDEEPCFCPPISDVNEIYDYWDIISGSLVWSPPSARVDTYTDTTEQETARSMVDETINGSPRKVSSQCPTLGMILEEDEDEDETAEQNTETSVAEENDVVGVPSSPTPAKGAENDTTDHDPESIVAGDNDEENNDSPTLVALPSPPIPVEHYARTLASTLLASTLQQISDEASPTGEQDENCDTSVSTDTCIGDSSGSSVTIYERTTASNTETSDLATISEDTEATETSISPSAADSAASKETVPMPASFQLSDRQFSFQGTVLEDGEPQSHPSVILAEQDIAEKHETCSAPGLLLSNCPDLANNDQQTTTALVATASSAPCVTETSGSHSTGGIDDLPQQESTLPSDAGDNADLDDDVMVFRSKSGELVHIVQLSSDTQPITSKKATSETQATTSQEEDRNETGVTEPETEGFASSSTGTGLTEDEVRASEFTPESSSQKLSADTKGTPQNPPHVKHVADEIEQLLGDIVDLRGGTRATQLSGGKPGTSDTRASSDMNTELAQHCTEYPTTGGRPATDTPEQSFKDAKSKETIPTRGPVRVKGPERTNIKFEDLLHNSSDCETASSTQRLASFPCRLTCGNSLCGACPQCKADKKSCVDTRFPADSTSRQTCNSLATLNGGHMCSVCTTQSELRTDGGCSDAKETVVWVPLSDIVRLEDNTSPSITAVRSVGEKQAQRQNVCTDGTKRSKGKKMSANRQVSSDPGMAVRGTDEKKVPLSTQTQAVKETASPKQLSKSSAVLIKGSSTPTGARKGPCGAPKSPPASASNYKQAVLKAKSSLGGSPLPSKLKTFGKSAPSLGAKVGTRSSKELKELPKSGATTGPVKASSDVSNMKKKTSGSASERQMNLKTKQETPDIPTTDNMETKTSKRRRNSPHKNGRSLLRRHTQPEPLAVGQSKEAVCGSTETSSLPVIPVAGVKEDCVLAWIKACHEQTEDATTAEHVVLHETERVGTNKDVTGTQSHTIFHHEPQVVAKPDTLSLPILPLTGVSEATSAGFAKAHSVAASHAGAQLKDKACKSRPKSTSLKRRSGRLSEPGSNRLPSLVLPSTPTSLPALPLTGSREEHNSQNLFKASGKAMTQIAVAEDGETCPSSGGVCVAASQPYEDRRSNEVVLQETATAQGWADMPMKSKSEAMSNRLPPPGPFSSLPKLPLTEDGTGYDAEAWIRANCDRVKQITSQTRGDSCDLHSLPMAEIRGMEMSTMKEARAFLKKKASRPTSAHISQPNTSQDTIDTHTRDSEEFADGSELKCAQATEAKQPEEFTLPKIPLTSDGKGYNATAWIRANAGRVKEMYAARQSNIRMIQSDTTSCGVLPQIKTKRNTSLPDIHC